MMLFIYDNQEEYLNKHKNNLDINISELLATLPCEIIKELFK
jgi:hypothetical protein